MRILVIGAGAVGAYFGARLHAAGRDVSFLVRSRRAEQLRRTGIQVVSPLGDFSVQPKLTSAEELRESKQIFDLILLSVKAYSLQSAMEDFAPAVGENTAILPLLNGMKHLEVLSARFGRRHVLGGSTRVVSSLDDEGRVIVFETIHDLVFGELDKQTTPRIRAIAKALAGAGFDENLSDDVLAFMWQKWVLLASTGGITCLMRGNVGEIEAVPGGVDAARTIAAECTTIATAEGYPPSAAFAEIIDKRLTTPGSSLVTSMYRDLTKGQPVEADQIIGDLIAHGAKHNLPMPLLRAAYAQLCVYQNRLKPV